MKCANIILRAIGMWHSVRITNVVIVIFLTAQVSAQAEDVTNNSVGISEVSRSLSTNNIYVIDKAASNFRKERNDFIEKLTAIIKNENTSNLSQCVAAYYLGELRSAEAASALAGVISLRLDMSRVNIIGLPPILAEMGQYPAVNALIKIGVPSVPALIQNLKDINDAKVRELSLKVLFLIDSDKDIVQMRLQKALKAEKDSQKQARLKAAIKSLAETSFVK